MDAELDPHPLDGARGVTRIMLRPFGSPLPLGFFAFGVGVLLTGLLEVGALPASEWRMVALVGLCFCLPLELIGSVLAFLARDGAGGTILGVFATSWAVLGAGVLVAGTPAASPSLGVFHLFLALVCLLIAAAALKSKPFFAVLLALAAVRFGFAGAAQLSGVTPLRVVGGVVGFVLTVVALYGAEALLLEDTRQRTVLPLFRRHRARAAMEGSLRDQLDRVEREAGVRQQL